MQEDCNRGLIGPTGVAWVNYDVNVLAYASVRNVKLFAVIIFRE